MFWNKNIDNIENLLIKILREIENIHAVYSSSFVQKMIKKINEMPCEDLYVCYINNGVPGWLIARTLNIPSDRVSDLPFNRIMRGVYLRDSIENIVKSKSLSLDKTKSKKKVDDRCFFRKKKLFQICFRRSQKESSNR